MSKELIIDLDEKQKVWDKYYPELNVELTKVTKETFYFKNIERGSQFFVHGRFDTKNGDTHYFKYEVKNCIEQPHHHLENIIEFLSNDYETRKLVEELVEHVNIDFKRKYVYFHYDKVSYKKTYNLDYNKDIDTFPLRMAQNSRRHSVHSARELWDICTKLEKSHD